MTPENSRDIERGLMMRAALMISSMEMSPLCLMFLTFFLSLGGSLRALMMRAAAEGPRSKWPACLDLELDSHLQTFPVSGSLGNVVTNLLGRQTKGSNLGGREEVAPTSPPTALR
eukprot:TRINITY_DN148_c0_g1_i9.p1 TRINITY_DN148_c0_g1~~TRINITY_DN148_c0_g1_i9.p1  ORF type:complete len:115 (+),score=16.85 TRINITY_DN148_c0_g1_i9:142-486(+)